MEMQMLRLCVAASLVWVCCGNLEIVRAGVGAESMMVALRLARGPNRCPRGTWLRLRGGEEDVRGSFQGGYGGGELDHQQRAAMSRFRRVLDREKAWIETNAIDCAGTDTRAALSAAPSDAQIRELLERSNWVVETAVSVLLRGSDEHADERQREVQALNGQLTRFADTMGEEESAEHEANALQTERQAAFARKRARAEEASFKRAVAMGEAKRQCREQFARRESKAVARDSGEGTVAGAGGGAKQATWLQTSGAEGAGGDASELGEDWGGSAISGASMLAGVTNGLATGESGLGMGDSVFGLGGSVGGNLTGIAEQARKQVDAMILGIDEGDPFGLDAMPGASVEGVTEGETGKKEMLRRAMLEEHQRIDVIYQVVQQRQRDSLSMMTGLLREFWDFVISPHIGVLIRVVWDGRVYQAAAKRADLEDAAEEGRQRRQRKANAEEAKKLLQKRFGGAGRAEERSAEEGESAKFGIELPSSIQAALQHVKEPLRIQTIPAMEAEEGEKQLDVTIEMLSDPSCPWCYLAQAMLKGAISQLIKGRESTVALRIQWQPYIASQEIPRTGLRVEEYVEYMGLDQGWVDRILDQGRQVVVQGGEEESELFGKWRYWPYSLHAQRMLLDARERGGEPLVAAGLELLQSLTFQQGMNTGSLQVLCAVAAELGMQDPVGFLLSKKHYADLMRFDQRSKHEDDIVSVPLFRIRWTRDSTKILQTVSGPQGTDEWILMLKEVLGDGSKEEEELDEQEAGLRKQDLGAIHAKGFGGKQVDAEASETSEGGGGGKDDANAEVSSTCEREGEQDSEAAVAVSTGMVSRAGGDETGVGVMAW